MRRYYQTVKTLLGLASDHPFYVIQNFLSALLYNFAELLPPIAAANIIAVITEGEFHQIWLHVIFYAVFYALNLIMLSWNMYTYRILDEYYHHAIQQRLFEHISNNDSIFDKISQGKISDTCVDDVRYMSDVIDCAAWSISDFIQLVVTFCIFAYYNIFVAILAIAVDLIYIVLMNRNSRNIARHYEGTRKYEDKTADIFNQMLNNLHQVKSLNIMPQLSKKFERTRNDWAVHHRQKQRSTIIRYGLMPIIIYTGKILMYILLGYLVVNGQMTIDKLVLLISYFEMLISVTDDMQEYLLNLSQYGIRVKRIKNILDYTQDDVDYGDLENDYIIGSVTFDNVYYQINRKIILNNVSFKAYPNEVTAIVGHPSAGKTSIINLLYRLVHVKSGSILIDDESIYNYSKKVYPSNVSGVFQKPFIFKMSIAENLGLADSNRQHQIDACKRVGIHDIINSLPKGYNTVIDQDHPILTDGQIQKLSIARALLTRAEILLFDEITSNIDPASTADIIKIIQDLKDDHTIIIITHKPEIMDIADRIIVMDHGKVVAKGLNQDVYKRCNLYRELKNANFAGPSILDE